MGRTAGLAGATLASARSFYCTSFRTRFSMRQV